MDNCPFGKYCMQGQCMLWISEEEDCSINLTARYLGEILGEILRMEKYLGKK